MDKKLKILQITPRFPFPADDGGKIGIANIYKQFYKQNCDVTLFSLNNEIIPKKAIEEAKQYGEVYIIKQNTNNTLFKIFKSFILNQSLYINKHINNNIIKHLFNLIKNSNFDIIHCDHTCMAPLALKIKDNFGIPFGLRLHNIEHLIWKRYYDRLAFYHPGKLFIKQQYRLLQKWESYYIKKADINFAITEKDYNEALILSGYKANIIIASAGVDVDEWEPDNSTKRNKYELILATTFKWKHNVDGITWFIKNVLSVLKEKIPEITLTLIGKSPPNFLFRYKHLGVNCIGYVDKVQPYYNRANLNISPLFVGSGIRIKILEAMSMELPVIATPIAAEGINANESDGLIIALNKDEFITKIIEMISNTKLRYELGKSARNFVKNFYTWDSTVSKMIDSYHDILSKNQ